MNGARLRPAAGCPPVVLAAAALAQQDARGRVDAVVHVVPGAHVPRLLLDPDHVEVAGVGREARLELARAERVELLDSQDADLNDALRTLENSIAKIDKKTRTRFKETFESVNKRLGELFPKVFGGGHAYLELTGEDLLDTGFAGHLCQHELNLLQNRLTQ